MLAALISFVGESRAIQYFLSLLMVVVSMGIVYGDATVWITAAFIIFCPYLFIQSLGVLIFTGKKIKVSDDDLSYYYWKGAYMKYYRSHICPFIAFMERKHIALGIKLRHATTSLGRSLQAILDSWDRERERKEMIEGNREKVVVVGGGQEDVREQKVGETERANPTTTTWEAWVLKFKAKIKVTPH